MSTPCEVNIPWNRCVSNADFPRCSSQRNVFFLRSSIKCFVGLQTVEWKPGLCKINGSLALCEDVQIILLEKLERDMKRSLLIPASYYFILLDLDPFSGVKITGIPWKNDLTMIRTAALTHYRLIDVIAWLSASDIRLICQCICRWAVLLNGCRSCGWLRYGAVACTVYRSQLVICESCSCHFLRHILPLTVCFSY